MKKHINIIFSLVIVMMSVLMNAGHLYAANNALQFNGTNQYVQLLPSYSGINFSGSNDFTISMWFKGNGGLYNQHATAINQCEIFLTAPAASGGKIRLAIAKNSVGWDTNLYSIQTVDTTVWNHVAITRTGNNLYLYINGQLDNQEPLSVSVSATQAAGNMYIGYDTNVGGYFTGQIDEVRIWNTARTQTQILSTMWKPLTGSEPNLVAYYNFNQTSPSTTLPDVTGHGYNGTLTNGPAWVVSGAMPQPGHALSFDGTDDYVQLPAGVYFNGDLTIESWVYVRNYGNYSRLIDFGNGQYSDNVTLPISYSSSGKPGLAIYNGASGKDLISPTAIPLNTWTHIAATLSGTTGVLYINGVPVATDPAMLIPQNITRNNCFIGKSNWAGESYADAIFDEVRIWNTARTATQIQDNMMKDVTGSAWLVAYYKFDEGTAGGTNTGITTAIDSAGTNNGTLTNFALTGASSNWVASSAFNVWTGATDTQWTTATNWSRGTVPSSSDNVYIPASASNQPIISSAQSCNNLVTETGATLTINNNFSLSVYGNVFNGGTITGSYYLKFSGTSPQRIKGGTLSGSSALQMDNPTSLILESNLTIPLRLNMNNGTINLNGYTLSYSPGGSILAYGGSSPQTTTDAEFPASCGPANLNIGNTVTLHADRTLSASLYLLSGKTLNANGHNLTIAGSFANFGGTFTAGTGTVTLSGTNQDISGNNTFYNFTKIVSSADTLLFEAGTTQTITGALTLQGAAGNLLSLNSSWEGNQWNINAQGTRNLSYLNVKDSNNTNAALMIAAGSTDSGNNTKWAFFGPGVSMDSVTPSASTAVANATATDPGVGISERGFFVWNDSYSSGLVPAGAGAGAYSLTLTGLTPQRTYNVSAYIIAGGTRITAGNPMTFTTTASAPPGFPDTLPSVIVNGRDATITTELAGTGSSPIIVYGFVYALHPVPTVWDMALPLNGATLPGTFTGTLKALAPGTYYLRAYAHSSVGTTYGPEISFVITDPSNHEPVIAEGSSVSATVIQGETWTPPTITASDTDKDTLTWSMKTSPANGTVVVSGTGASPQTFTYQPKTGFTGTDSFAIQVSDGRGGIASITINVVIKDLSNHEPVIAEGSSVSATVIQGETWTPPTITASDIDKDTLTWSMKTSPANGTAFVSGTGASPQTFTYQPKTDFTGTDSFAIQVSDGRGGIASITINVTVNAVIKNLGIQGRVHDGVKGIANIEVNIFSQKKNFAANLITDADGNYSVTGLGMSDDYQVSIYSDQLKTSVFYAIPAGEKPGVYIPTESAFSADGAALITPTDPPIKNIDIVVKLVADATIQGHVYAADGKPIAGVWVNAWSDALIIGSGAYTDDTGYYLIYGLKAVSAADAATKGYIVDAMPPSDNSQTYPSKVATGVSGIDFHLKAGFSISGNVKDMNLKAVSGAKVYAASKTSSAQKNGTAFTDSEGNYTISGLDPAWDYIVSASDPNYSLQYYNKTSELSKAAPVDLMLSDVQGIDFVLDKGLVIRGTVSVGTTPATGITVNAQSASLPKFGDAKTDAQGKYEIIGLDQTITDYIISVRQTGYVPAYYASSGTVLVREQADKVAPTAYSQAPERNIVLTSGFKISGMITFNGQGLSGITAETISPTTGERATFISASGSYSLSGLMPGSYDVVFRSTDYEELHKTVVIADKDILLNVSLIAKPLRTVSGTVSGLPVSKTVMISAWSASENKRSSVFVEGTGGAVTYSITDLTPLSDYIVEMSSDDYPYQAFKNKLRPDEADWVDLSKSSADGIDFTVPSQLATISGSITFPSDVVVGDTAQITVYSPSRNITLSTQVQTSGLQIVSYTITKLLPASDYIVYISSPKYVDHYYNGTDDGTLSESEATRYDLSKTLTAVVNFKLSAGRSLSGKVLDPNQKPKAGLTVELWSETVGAYESGVTSADGSYLIKGIHSAPDYEVYVTDPAFGVFYYYKPSESVRNQLFASSVSTMAGNVSGIDIIVSPTESISGRITSPKGQPLEFMWVEAWSELQQSGDGAFTDENGDYQLTGLSKGSDYTVIARPDWYYPPVEKQHIATNTTGLDFTLDPDQGSTMSGTVKNSRGQIVPKVTIELWSESLGINGEIWAVSDNSGKYKLKGLPQADDYRLMISPDKDTPYSFSIVENVSLPMSGNAIDITVVEGSRISGRVTDKDTGAGITDADVTALAPGIFFKHLTETGHNGEYVIPNVPVSSTGYNITIIKSGYIGQTLTASSDQTINFVLEKIGAITGIVRDRKTGKPLSGITVEAASISMSGTDYYSASAITSEDGQYLINGLKSRDSQNAVLNDYTVTVLAPGYPSQSVGAKKLGETADFYLSKGAENTISGTIADSDGTVPPGIDFAVEAFEQSGRFVSSASADNTGKFDISTLAPEKQYYLKITAYSGKNPTVSQWADSSNIGVDNPLTDDSPSGAKLYHTNTVVNFKFSKPVKTSSVPPAHSKPAPVRNVKSFTHIIGKVTNTALRGSAGPDYIPPSNNPTPTLTYTPPPGAKCYVSYNTDPAYTIDKRNAPESPPAGSPQSTGNNMSGDGKVVYAHIAVVDERGRIGETITVAIKIDTVPPTNGVAKAPASSSGDTVSLKLGASGPGVKDMSISNTGFGKNADWETRVKDKDWKLSEGDGKKDVYVQYRDDAKNVANYKISVNKTTPKPPAKPGTPGTGNTKGVYIENQKFVVDINAPDGTVIGTVIAYASSEEIVFTILSGNTGNVFSIDPYTGKIKIANSSLLIKNGTKNYEMPVQVSDGKNTKIATITVQVVDKSKDKLIVADQSFSTDKSFESGTYIGTVTAVAADSTAVLSYHIISGNDDEIFAINTKTGDIVIADAAKLSVKQYVLTVEVSDGKNKATGKITVDVTGDQVFVSDKNFSVDENAAIGTVLGTVTASSANSEAVFSYGIVSGNTDSVFAIDSASGAISLIGALNYDRASSYTLGIEVSDGKNKGTANVKISVNPISKETLKGTWSWINPAIPGASSAWFKNITGISQSEMIAVGGRFDYDASRYQNLIYHYSDGIWSEKQSNSSEWLYDVWGRSASDIFAVGWAGTILHYDGTQWTPMPSPTSENLYAAAGDASTVIAVGEKGTVLVYDGSAWHTVDSGTTATLYGISGENGNFISVGGSGTILKYEDSIWTYQDSMTAATLYSVWGRSPSDVYAAGDGGTILHYDGVAWTAQRSGGTEKFRSITGFGKYVFAAGENGVVFYTSGRGWSQLPTETHRNFMGIWADDSSVSVVGDNGAILRFLFK